MPVPGRLPFCRRWPEPPGCATALALRVIVMRVLWLAAALSAGTLAARSLAGIGHVAGIAGLPSS